MGVLGYLMDVLGYLMGVLGYLMGVLGYPMAWRWRQFMAKWCLGQRKWRGPGPGPGMGAPRHFLRPKRHLAMAWRRRQAMGTPSNWERPVNGNAIPLNGNAHSS